MGNTADLSFDAKWDEDEDEDYCVKHGWVSVVNDRVTCGCED